jgi:UDP-N-acetylmuramate-alanine ligase
VIVTEIYRSREEAQDYSARLVAEAIQRRRVQFITDLPAVADYLFVHLRPGDVLIVLSAGDADRVSTQVLAHLRGNEVEHD